MPARLLSVTAVQRMPASSSRSTKTCMNMRPESNRLNARPSAARTLPCRLMRLPFSIQLRATRSGPAAGQWLRVWFSIV